MSLLNATSEAIKLLQSEGYDIVRRNSKLKLASQGAHPMQMWDKDAGFREYTRRDAARRIGEELLKRGDVFRHEVVYTDGDKEHPFYNMGLVVQRSTFEFYHPLGVEFRR